MYVGDGDGVMMMQMTVMMDAHASDDYDDVWCRLLFLCMMYFVWWHLDVDDCGEV